MSHQIKANYDQNFLLPPSLEDWIAEDHPARFIREFVNQLDLKELGFKVDDNEEGRPYYSTDMLLKIWLYGYFNRIRSPRQLEKQCKENISVIWLTGMNYPDHNTIWRFWKLNKSKFREVFKQSVTIAKQLGLIDMTLNALDGTKIKAYSSNSGVLNKKRLEELLKETDKIIEKIETEIESFGEAEEGQGSYSLPEKLQDKIELKIKISEALKELKEIDRENYHPEEEEARIMKTSGKKELSYNAQAVVDSKHQIIVGQDVINNENDAESLVPMLKNVEEITELKAELTIADSGYATGEQIFEAEENKSEVLFSVTEKSNISAAIREDEPFHSSNFKYAKEQDVMICPQSKQLKFYEHTRTKNKKHKVRKYKCSDYEGCQYRWQCSKSKTGREVKLNPFHESIERQRLKQQDNVNNEKLKKRKQLIEPVFAWIKEGALFRRFTTKGLENAKQQWSMICTGINLKKMHKLWSNKKLKFT
jgi:transposase